MAKEAVILIADLHCNSTLGLCKPGLQRDDGELYELNQIQRWLWHTWEKFLDDVDGLVNGYRVNLILVGDLVELDSKARSWQIISKNPSTAIHLCVDIIEPLVQVADTVFILRGTEAHSGRSAWSEEEIAKDLKAEPEPDTGARSWWHLRAGFSGVSFDIAHHAPMGNLFWTYGNSAPRLAIGTMMDYMDWGERPPDIVARAHNHRFADSGRTYSTRGIFLPGWQFHTAYLHRLGKANARPHIGACVFLCDDGKYKFHDLRYRPVRSEAWKSKQ